jgi:hypothetical protein
MLRFLRILFLLLAIFIALISLSGFPSLLPWFAAAPKATPEPTPIPTTEPTAHPYAGGFDLLGRHYTVDAEELDLSGISSDRDIEAFCQADLMQ